MRKKIIAGNWKMNKNPSETVSFLTQLNLMVNQLDINKIEVIVSPAFTSLANAKLILNDSSIKISAQNVNWEDKGAFTGEVSAGMLNELCEYVIIGHSERRQYFHETDEIINKKIIKSISHNLNVILCVGESLEENESGNTVEIVSNQIKNALVGIDANTMEQIVIAYEPIWAIGTGKAASADGANTIHHNAIRVVLTDMFGEQIANETRILYGGSVKPNNAREYFSQPDIDGALVGGASLNENDFVAIIEAAL